MSTSNPGSVSGSKHFRCTLTAFSLISKETCSNFTKISVVNISPHLPQESCHQRWIIQQLCWSLRQSSMEEAQKPLDKDYPSRHLSILGVLGDELPQARKVSGVLPVDQIGISLFFSFLTLHSIMSTSSNTRVRLEVYSSRSYWSEWPVKQVVSLSNGQSALANTLVSTMFNDKKYGVLGTISFEPLKRWKALKPLALPFAKNRYLVWEHLPTCCDSVDRSYGGL